MRARIFRKLLKRYKDKTPGCIASLEIQILLDTTARGFCAGRRRVWFRRPQAALRHYARFTAECMGRTGAEPERLYNEAYRTGRMVRRVTGFRRSSDINELISFLYRNIGISMAADIPRGVTVSSCYFSGIYTPEQCAVMSNVDSGIIAGIYGTGRLEFSERLTEGCSCCRAVFDFDFIV